MFGECDLHLSKCFFFLVMPALGGHPGRDGYRLHRHDRIFPLNGGIVAAHVFLDEHTKIRYFKLPKLRGSW